MKRRHFIQNIGLATTGALCSNNMLLEAKSFNNQKFPELAKHRIDRTELIEVNYHWPRLVGKNGKKDVHGQHKKFTALRLYTDQGAIGWGMSSNRVKDHLSELKGKKVSDLIEPEKGILPDVNQNVDFALHDLMGVILDKPVYQLLGAKGTKETPVYSGMIYLDELEPKENPAGLGIIIENCLWDYDYGYRQLKIKIGRSGRWYPHDQGLSKDIEVVKLVHDAFKDKNVDILVDSNDMYNYQDTIDFLAGIGDIPIFWVEEPFAEDMENGQLLRKWMDNNGFSKTLYADGEANPDHDLCLEMARKDILDVYLPDVHGYGFTNWIKLMPELTKRKCLASPHAWGNMLKTHYISHLAAGLGNIVTIEGVTCLSDEIDFGKYYISEGKIIVSDQPGFGMTLLI